MSELYPYQEEGVTFLSERARALLCDAPGLGKTAQATCAVEVLDALRVLVVCPNIVKWQWANEIAKWTPGRHALVCDQGRAGAESFAVCAPLNKYNVMHWSALRLLPPEFFKLKWDVLIADEVHYMCNRNAQRTKVLKSIKADVKWGLSATPYRNWIDDLWSILHWLDKKTWSSYWRFYEEHMVYVDATWGRDVMGERNLDRLATQLSGLVLRREKADVAPWLPPLTTTYLPIEMSESAREYYKKCRKELRVTLEDGSRRGYFILNPLMRTMLLRQATSVTRVKAAFSLLQGLSAPVVVFAYFKSEAQELANTLGAWGDGKRPYRCITSDTDGTKRENALRWFRDAAKRYLAVDGDWETEGPVLIMTLGVGSVGLDLDEADTVVFAGASWSSVEMTQALERIHRVSSTRPKHAYYLACKGTIDEIVLWAAESKADRRAFALAALNHVQEGR